MSKLSTLPAIKTKSSRRVGRGYGSTKGGHTSGRGTKGQLSRQGAKVPLWFEGGQLPLIKRIPMQRGKGLLKATSLAVAVTLNDLQKMKSDSISMDTLILEKIVPQRAARVKVIATGTLSKKVTLKGLAVSQKAREEIEKVGGTVEN